MQQRKPRQRSQQRLAIANDFNGVPPTKPPRLAIAATPRDPSLTAKFNRAAKHPQLSRPNKQALIQKQINALRREMSQPRPTLEFGTMGSANNARNPKRDRLLQRKITALSSQLKQTAVKKSNGLNKSRGLAGNHGLAKKQFNRAAQGLGM